MLTRRETIAAGTAAAILAGIGISPAIAAPSRRTETVDRELRLSISDGFTRQTWTYAGQVWTETRDTLTFHEDEAVRVTILNDAPGMRVVSLGNGAVMRLASGEAKSVVLGIDRVAPFEIAVVGQPMISRAARVRANYGAHANVA